MNRQQQLLKLVPDGWRLYRTWHNWYYARRCERCDILDAGYISESGIQAIHIMEKDAPDLYRETADWPIEDCCVQVVRESVETIKEPSEYIQATAELLRPYCDDDGRVTDFDLRLWVQCGESGTSKVRIVPVYVKDSESVMSESGDHHPIDWCYFKTETPAPMTGQTASAEPETARVDEMDLPLPHYRKRAL